MESALVIISQGDSQGMKSYTSVVLQQLIHYHLKLSLQVCGQSSNSSHILSQNDLNATVEFSPVLDFTVFPCFGRVIRFFGLVS